MKTFAVMNTKGGVGKTTAAVSLAYLLAVEHRRRVLLVDAAPQADATHTLLRLGRNGRGLAGLLSGYAALYDEIVTPSGIPGLDVIPASDELWDLDWSCGGPFCGAAGALRDFRDAAAEDGAYDVAVIDCPSSFSAACVSAVNAADHIIIPVLPDAYSAVGLAGLVRRVRRMRPDGWTAACLMNQWRPSDAAEDAAAYLREESPVPVFDTAIRWAEEVTESTWAREPAPVWGPGSAAAQDYRAWVRELAEAECAAGAGLDLQEQMGPAAGPGPG